MATCRTGLLRDCLTLDTSTQSDQEDKWDDKGQGSEEAVFHSSQGQVLTSLPSPVDIFSSNDINAVKGNWLQKVELGSPCWVHLEIWHNLPSFPIKTQWQSVPTCKSVIRKEHIPPFFFLAFRLRKRGLLLLAENGTMGYLL